MALEHVAQGDAHVTAHNDERDAIVTLQEQFADMQPFINEIYNDVAAETQNTGWRKFAAGHNTAVPSFTCFMRRIGRDVEFYFGYVGYNVPTIPNAIPYGFRPSFPDPEGWGAYITLTCHTPDAQGNAVINGLSIACDNLATIPDEPAYIGTVGGYLDGMGNGQLFTWKTDDPWPTVLPGTNP